MKRAICKGALCTGIFFAIIFVSFHLTCAAEDKFPSKSMELICSFPAAGGPLDLHNRLLAKFLEKELKVTVVPVNKPGGGGTLAGAVLAGSRPDGHTLALMAETSVIMPILTKEASFSLKDFRFIGQVNRGFPVVLNVAGDAPWKTFQEFIDHAKANPGIKCGHPPVTTTAALKMAYLNQYAKLGMVGLPFKTDSEIFAGLLGKHFPVAVNGIGGGLFSNVEAGKLRVLFSFHPAGEIDLDPKIPNFESFFGKAPFDFAVHLLAPAKTPEETVRILKKTLEKIVKSPEFASDMKKLKFTPYYKDGDVFAKEVLPKSAEKLKEIMTETGMLK
ncbi:MAG: tripartite tricarboxylate transporter substrate binding protein [Thermodesulfobacteriota bacterium]